MKVSISRRSFLASASVGAAATVPTTSLLAAAKPGRLAVVDLRTSQLARPLGLDDRRPTLSWRLEGTTDFRQTAYRIRVASSEHALPAGPGDLWDSGWLASSDACHAIYAGQPVSSRQRCFWIVEVRDAAGVTFASDVAWWEMGLLASSDWSGTWLAAEDELERDDRAETPLWSFAAAPSSGVRLFRLPFESGESEALVTLAVDGILTSLTLDGKSIEIPRHDPNAFGGRPALRASLPMGAGRHVLAAEVAALPGYFAKPQVGVAAQIRLEGKESVRRISQGWRTSLDPSGPWRQPGAPESGWSPATSPEPQPLFPWPATPASLLRREFTLDAAPNQARLYVAALGGYELWINGQRVGDGALQPEQSDFAHHLPYRSHDVARLLRRGVNVVAAVVGDGYYASYMAPTGRYSFGPAPRRLLLQLEARLAGRTTIVATDKEWRIASSPIRYSEIYGGEDQDSAFEQRGWTEPGFDARAWSLAWAAPTPTVPLVARMTPPVRITRQLAPVAIRRLAADRHIVDFGQNFAGRVRLKLPAGAATSVRVRHAEVLGADGELDRRNLRAARAEDNYRLATGVEATLEPTFTYQGFRYAEILGPRSLDVSQVGGLVMSSDLKETGTISIGNPLIQKIWTNTLWSQRSNFVGVPTDCPQRDERLGWTGDAQVFWDAAAFNMDVGMFTREWLREVRAGQSAGGAFPLWAPIPAAASFGPQAVPGWSDVGIMLPYISYLRYGDRAIVDENWLAMRRYVDGVLRTNPDGLWTKERGADFGDWLSVDAKSPADETTPKTLVATAMLARSLAQLASMAGWTGRDAEAVELRRLHDRVRSAFAKTFVTSEGRVGNGSQTSHILALALDLAPQGTRSRVADLLVADIRKRGTALSTGFLGTPLALDALADTGHADVAYDLLLRSDFPSWGHMIRKGATTMWERWNGDTGDIAMNSFNHYAFGAVTGFLYRRLGGITPLTPGFASVRIAPALDPRTGDVTCRYDSVRGPIEVDVRHVGTKTSLSVRLPAGMHGEVLLPAGAHAIGEGTRSASGSEAIYNIRQGRHDFIVGQHGATGAHL
ncbi:family 78 glycoside hydrolase catalytic domain (plasmid) [Sphingomonas aliaeris]|uniref:alpha-L-rhamnosidase n=1 Tax=Sphingomonas aliaeris TaxID=2759526 RepID=A0A974NYH9_9SPHN|nr:alpha-L-rhamnosidase [Sphingomonas aliaeris]QQV79424.1 family 78 glycoside hydrolase catalytic domain [Sphingomonas aliaeris]